jgi:predicted nucleic acid-binding protein
MTGNARVIYWDSSAILSALFTDTHSKTAKKWVDTKGLHFISTLANAEVSAVIARMKREHVLVETLVNAAFEILDQGPWRRIYTLPEWEIVRVLAAKWPLRGADLWHLATAITLQKDFPELTFVTFDKRLKNAAKREALCESKF